MSARIRIFIANLLPRLPLLLISIVLGMSSVFFFPPPKADCASTGCCSTNLDFTDVKTTDSYYLAVKSLANACIFRGYIPETCIPQTGFPPPCFAPTAHVKRIEVTFAITRYHLKVIQPGDPRGHWTLSTNPNPYFADVTLATYDPQSFYEVQTAYEYGLVKGQPCGTERCLDPGSDWLYGFHGVTRDMTPAPNGTTMFDECIGGCYNFSVLSAPMSRSAFAEALFNYYVNKRDAYACLDTFRPGRIQGYKVLMPGNNPSGPQAAQRVSVADTSGSTINSATTNPYTFDNLPPTSYTVSVPPLAGYNIGYTLCYNSTSCHNNSPTPGTTVAVTVPPNGYADLYWHYTPVIPPTYTITGRIFVDTNANKKRDSGESGYPGAYTITINDSSAVVTTDIVNKTYRITNVHSGTYAVKLATDINPLLAGYTMTIPTSSIPPTFLVTAGSCPTTISPSSPDATCSSGNITELNFGIVQQQQWFQGYGFSMRVDRGFTDQIPNTASVSCGGANALLPLSAAQNSHGAVFTGNVNANLFEGQASPDPYNLLVGGLIDPDLFNPTQKTLSLAYANLRSIARTIIPLSSVCTLNNCVLPPNLPRGIYVAEDDVTLISSFGNPNDIYTVPNNTNVIILVKKNLIIKEKIHVPLSSTLLFSTGENIVVDAGVGQAIPACGVTSPGTGDLNGWFVAGKDFVLPTAADCTNNIADKTLAIQGTVITNSIGNTGGRVRNTRQLCGASVTNPVFTIQGRPDFVLNTPEILKKAISYAHEVSPN